MRRVLRVVAGLAVLATLSSVASAQEADLRDRQDAIQEQRQRDAERLEELRGQEQDVRVALAVAEEALADARARLARREQQLADAREALARARADAAEARRDLLRVNRRLAATEAELAEQQTRLEERVRAAFMYGQISFAEAFTGVRDIADFLNSSTYVAHVMAADRDLVEGVRHLLAEVEQQRGEAHQARVRAERQAQQADLAAREVEAAVADLQQLAAEVADRRAEQQRALEAVRNDQRVLEQHIASLEVESDRIGDQLAAIFRQQQEAARRAAEAEARRQAEEHARRQAEAEQQGQPGGAGDSGGAVGGDGSGSGEQAGPAPGGGASGPPPVNGTWTRPVPGPMTSPFGPRWGRNHNGVDLGGDVGTPVAASRTGSVVMTVASCHPTNSWGCGGGFGNYVVVDHGDGYATIYAHLSAVHVGVGTVVGNGQSVGAVGNSGSSFGSHLHFEIRWAGEPQNPCSYIHC